MSIQLFNFLFDLLHTGNWSIIFDYKLESMESEAIWWTGRWTQNFQGYNKLILKYSWIVTVSRPVRRNPAAMLGFLFWGWLVYEVVFTAEVVGSIPRFRSRGFGTVRRKPAEMLGFLFWGRLVYRVVFTAEVAGSIPGLRGWDFGPEVLGRKKYYQQWWSFLAFYLTLLLRGWLSKSHNKTHWASYWL